VTLSDEEEEENKNNELFESVPHICHGDERDTVNFENKENEDNIIVENTSFLMDSSPRKELNMSMMPMVQTDEDSDWDDTNEEMLHSDFNTSPVSSHENWSEDDASASLTTYTSVEEEDNVDNILSEKVIVSAEENIVFDDKLNSPCNSNAEGSRKIDDDEMSSKKSEENTKHQISETRVVNENVPCGYNHNILGINLTLTSCSDEEEKSNAKQSNLDEYTNKSITEEYTVDELIGEDILSTHNSYRFPNTSFVQTNSSHLVLNEGATRNKTADNRDRNANKKKNKKVIGKFIKGVIKLFKQSKPSKSLIPIEQEKSAELVECKRNLTPEFERGFSYLPENINTSKGFGSLIISCPQDIQTDTPTSMASVFANALSPVSSCGSSSDNSSGILDITSLATSTSTNVSQHVGWLKGVYSSPMAANYIASKGQRKI